MHNFSETKAAMESISEGNYLDLHNWVFTPLSFRILIEDLFLLGFTTLREKSFSDTSGCEFYITLQQNASGPKLSRMELMMMKEKEYS